MSQKPLFDAGPPDGTLTERQRLVLEYLRANRGVSADEAGALIHAHNGRHDAETRCDWCAKTGRQVLHALRKKKLAKRQRGVGWRALHKESPLSANGYDPSTAAIPF